mmetsp:Transcript_2022/g.2841  ORF Transcript_2022/g.2841 Transcript_2022/m.2841 type:complete len:88 (-) Transcript_2022:13-276(-)
MICHVRSQNERQTEEKQMKDNYSFDCICCAVSLMLRSKFILLCLFVFEFDGGNVLFHQKIQIQQQSSQGNANNQPTLTFYKAEYDNE